VAERLLSYDWPGNVRELENSIERAVALAVYDEITVDDLPPKVRDHHALPSQMVVEDMAELPTMQTVEDRYIQRVLKLVGGNKTSAAKVLGFDRRTLYRKLARLAAIEARELRCAIELPEVSSTLCFRRDVHGIRIGVSQTLIE
jgi:two-component system response regulator HydG